MIHKDELLAVLTLDHIDSYEDMGQHFHLSRERIRQLLEKHGIKDDVKKALSNKRRGIAKDIAETSGTLVLSFSGSDKVFVTYNKTNMQQSLMSLLRKLKSNTHHNKFFQDAFNESGIDSLKIESFNNLTPPELIRQKSEGVLQTYLQPGEFIWRGELGSVYNQKHIYVDPTQIAKLQRIKKYSRNPAQTSQYPNVYYHRFSNRWMSSVYANKKYEASYFTTEEEAWAEVKRVWKKHNMGIPYKRKIFNRN